MSRSAMLSEDQKACYWRGKYPGLVGLFYFFQGLYYLGTNLYVYTMMANWDVPTRQQGTVLAILGLPLYLKAFPGLLSDRVPIGRLGRRKPYILFGALLYLLGFTLLALVEEFGGAWVGAVLLTLFAWMLVDSALDGLTVDITPRERSGQMQGAAMSGRFLGMAFAGLLVPLLGPRLGWGLVLVCLGTGALIQSIVPLFIHVAPISRAVLRNEMSLKLVLLETFRRRLTWVSMLFFLFFSAGMYTGTVVSVYLLSELGWSDSAGMMTAYGVVVIGASFTGALGAFLVGRLPNRTLLSLKFYTGFVTVYWCTSLIWLLVYRQPDNLPLVYTAGLLGGLFLGAGNALTLALTMRVCPKSIEGFTFALMVSMGSLGAIALGQKTVTVLAEYLGGVLPALFTLIPFGLVSLIFLRFVLNSLTRQVLETPSPELQFIGEA